MDPNRENKEESSVKETKKDELITDKSIEDFTRSSYGDKKSNRNSSNLLWLVIGIGIGTALGAAFDMLGVGVAFGVVFGIVMGSMRRK